MDRNHIHGIPYYGTNSQEIEYNIRNSEITEEIVYDSLLELISKEATETKTVVIEDTTGMWLSYLRDIRFNYRDKKLFIPYYSYKTYSIPRGNIKRNYNGHLVLNNDTLDIRYEYNFKTLELGTINYSIILYDIEAQKKYKAIYKNLYNNSEFSIEEMYSLYINSCVNEDDYLLVKHTEGYHVINKYIKGTLNKERDLRKEYNLDDYESNNQGCLKYRDVRNYNSEQFIQLHGLNMNDIPYWKRILSFESYLYCVIQSGATPFGEFKSEWKKLENGKEFIKYGNDIKLIIKRYWLPNIEVETRKTWSRV
jgi:hypothetical protein